MFQPRQLSLPYLTEQERFFIEYFHGRDLITQRALHIFWQTHQWGGHPDDVANMQQLLDSLEAKGIIVPGDSAVSFPKDSSLHTSIVFRTSYTPET